jgi:hypothetical protein
MNGESRKIEDLFDDLCDKSKRTFPQCRQSLDAPKHQGVYVIRENETVLHVGRTLRAKNGLRQRLGNHLHGSSSFTRQYLKGKGSTLQEDGYTYQYLVLEDARKRALLEAYAIGTLCPKHIGLRI